MGACFRTCTSQHYLHLFDKLLGIWLFSCYPSLIDFQHHYLIPSAESLNPEPCASAHQGPCHQAKGNPSEHSKFQDRDYPCESAKGVLPVSGLPDERMDGNCRELSWVHHGTSHEAPKS